MKSAFSNMFIENRKKNVEYAKVSSSNLNDDSYTSTTTITQTDGEAELSLTSDQHEKAVPEIKKLNVNTSSTSSLNLGSLKTKERPIDRNKVLATIYKNEIGQDQSGSFSKSQIKKSAGDSSLIKYASFLSLAIVLFVGLYWSMQKGLVSDLANFVRSKPIATPAPVAVVPPPTPLPIETSNFSSTEPKNAPVFYNVTIESKPSGARLYLDGKDMGMITPVRTKIQGSKGVKIGLSLEGFTFYEKIEQINEEATTIRANLQPLPPMGYVSINVVNGGSSPVVYINDQAIDLKPPIRLYGVIANRPVTIRVTNPFAGLSAEKKIVVSANEKKEINLILTREASQEK